MGKKVLIGYGIKCDAVAGCIDTKNGSQPDPVKVSRGIFGATVGIDRLLGLLDKHGIKASWFVPAHTVESFPVQIAKIRERGHEIGLHGYSHEHVSSLTETQERQILHRSIETLRTFNGKTPLGWTAPACTTSTRTIHLLEEYGIHYDHSFMHHDCLLYRTPYSNYDTIPTTYQKPMTPPNHTNGNSNGNSNGNVRASTPPIFATYKLPEKGPTSNPQPQSPSPTNHHHHHHHHPSPTTWMHPMSPPQLSSLITVPYNPDLTDVPLPSIPYHLDPSTMLSLYKSLFRYYYTTYPSFIFPISISTEISSKPQVLDVHERFIKWVNRGGDAEDGEKRFDGVEWCAFGDMVERYKTGAFEGGWDVVGDGMAGRRG